MLGAFRGYTLTHLTRKFSVIGECYDGGRYDTCSGSVEMTKVISQTVELSFRDRKRVLRTNLEFLGASASLGGFWIEALAHVA